MLYRNSVDLPRLLYHTTSHNSQIKPSDDRFMDDNRDMSKCTQIHRQVRRKPIPVSRPRHWQSDHKKRAEEPLENDSVPLAQRAFVEMLGLKDPFMQDHHDARKWELPWAFQGASSLVACKCRLGAGAGRVISRKPQRDIAAWRGLRKPYCFPWTE